MAVRGRDCFSKHKKLILLLSKLVKIFPLCCRKRLFEHYRSTKGIKGLAIRYILLKSIAKKCGDNVSIHPDCYIFHTEKLEIGDNVSIHPMCYIEAIGGLSIGNDVSIAHSVTLLTTGHQFDRHDIPIKDQSFIVEKTTIEDNVWIGAKATVLCGNTVNAGAVIGAGAVVTHDIEENAVAVGVPAKVIKKR